MIYKVLNNNSGHPKLTGHLVRAENVDTAFRIATTFRLNNPMGTKPLRRHIIVPSLWSLMGHVGKIWEEMNGKLVGSSLRLSDIIYHNLVTKEVKTTDMEINSITELIEFKEWKE